MAAEGVDRPAPVQSDVMNAWVIPLIVEAIGPLALCYAGISAIIATGGSDLVAIALAHGLAIGLMVAATGHISGGVYNPAITLGLLIAGKLKPDKALAYVIAQLVGALIGALLVKATFSTQAVDLNNLGVPAVAKDVSAGRAVVAEIVATFFLMYVFYGSAVDARGPRAIAPLAIGLTIAMDILAVGPISGAAMNPARWFGPAIVQLDFNDWWVYWVAPGIGAAIAAITYAYIYLGGRDAA